MNILCFNLNPLGLKFFGVVDVAKLWFIIEIDVQPVRCTKIRSYLRENNIYTIFQYWKPSRWKLESHRKIFSPMFNLNMCLHRIRWIQLFQNYFYRTLLTTDHSENSDNLYGSPNPAIMYNSRIRHIFLKQLIKTIRFDTRLISNKSLHVYLYVSFRFHCLRVTLRCLWLGYIY